MEKMKDLVKKLLESTQLGNVIWEESPKPDAYQSSAARFSIVIREIPSSSYNEDGNFASDYILEVINSDGIIVDSVVDTQLTKAFGPGAYLEMKEIYDRARRKALGADDAIDKIIQDLTMKDLLG